jgi:hypothetical protein
VDLYQADKLARRTRAKLAHHMAHLADDMSDRARSRHERRAAQLRKLQVSLAYDLRQLTSEEF